MKKITRGRIDDFLKKYATNNRVLDLGSGGYEYGKHFPNRVTVDIDPGKKPEIVADAHNLPFAENSFDVVLCTEVLEHLRAPEKAIGEMRRVLKSGGLLLVTTRFLFPIHDAPGDFWRFTRFGLINLFEGMEIIEIRAEASAFSTIAVLLQRIIFQTKLRLNVVSKAFLVIMAKLITFGDKLLVKQFGSIEKTKEVEEIMTSGYYLAAKNIK